MLAEEDSARRFDYLFEPLDSADESDEVNPPANVQSPKDRGGTARRLSFLGFVAGAVVVAIVTVGALVERPPVPEEQAPIAPPRPSTTAPEPVVAPSALLPPVVAPPAAPPPAVVRPQPQTPARVAPPVTSLRPPPERREAPTPTLRTPLSVAPEPRPAFPDQQRRDGGKSDDGGLLGIGGPGGLL